MTGLELVNLGTQLVNTAQAQGRILRMVEGVAILARCPTIETQPALQREYLDLDLVSDLAGWETLAAFFQAQGYGEKSDRALAREHARVFVRDAATVEVFHPHYQRHFQFDLTARVSATPLTLPLADLLLLKLARTDFEQKDIQDCAALLVDHRVTNGGDEAEDINREYLYPVVNRDYRLWKTVFDNTVTLEKIYDKYLEPDQAQLAWRRTELLQEVLDGKSHSLSWWARRVLTR